MYPTILILLVKLKDVLYFQILAKIEKQKTIVLEDIIILELNVFGFLLRVMLEPVKIDHVQQQILIILLMKSHKLIMIIVQLI